jgi:hypothetical protein
LPQDKQFWSLIRAFRRWDPRVHGDHAAEVPPVIALAIGFLALFSLLSILLGNDDPRHVDPRDDIRLWMRFGLR